MWQKNHEHKLAMADLLNYSTVLVFEQKESTYTIQIAGPVFVLFAFFRGGFVAAKYRSVRDHATLAPSRSYSNLIQSYRSKWMNMDKQMYRVISIH